MSLKRNLIVGSAAVVASDLLSGYAAVLNVLGSLPVAGFVTAIAGAYAGEMVLGEKPSLMRAAILGVTALGSATLKTSLTDFSFSVGGYDVTRPLAAAAGIWAGNKAGLVKSA